MGFYRNRRSHDFEETEQYKAKRIAERFAPAMLQRYGRALGLDPFDPDFYGTTGALFESELEGGVKRQMTFEEAAGSR